MSPSFFTDAAAQIVRYYSLSAPLMDLPPWAFGLEAENSMEHFAMVPDREP